VCKARTPEIYHVCDRLWQTFKNGSEYGCSGNYTGVGITERQDGYLQVAVSLSAELLNIFAPQNNIFAKSFREPSFRTQHTNTLVVVVVAVVVVLLLLLLLLLLT
jgi:hypothetical protein